MIGSLIQAPQTGPLVFWKCGNSHIQQNQRVLMCANVWPCIRMHVGSSSFRNVPKPSMLEETSYTECLDTPVSCKILSCLVNSSITGKGVSGLLSACMSRAAGMHGNEDLRKAAPFEGPHVSFCPTFVWKLNRSAGVPTTPSLFGICPESSTRRRLQDRIRSMNPKRVQVLAAYTQQGP